MNQERHPREADRSAATHGTSDAGTQTSGADSTTGTSQPGVSSHPLTGCVHPADRIRTAQAMIRAGMASGDVMAATGLSSEIIDYLRDDTTPSHPLSPSRAKQDPSDRRPRRLPAWMRWRPRR